MKLADLHHGVGRTDPYALLQSIILFRDRAPDPGADTYTVVAGDTVRIAERVLGDRSRWHELATANPSVDPDDLEPGERLVLR
ncbi:MAG: LysM domain-containing protein [Myxococcota bacterium]